MIVDQEDILILKYFSKIREGKTIKDYDLMRKIYPNGKTKEYMRFIRKIKKMEGYGLFTITEDNYELDGDKVILKKINYDEKQVESICIFVDGKWACFEI